MAISFLRPVSAGFKALLAAAIILPATACATMDAQPDRMQIMAASYHVADKPLNNGKRFNPVNPGVFLTWEGEPVNLTAGAYYNSYRKPSVAAFASLPLIEEGGFALDVFGGAAYYPEDGRTSPISIGDIVPMVGVQARYEYLYVNVMPSDCAFTCAVVSTGFTFAF